MRTLHMAVGVLCAAIPLLTAQTLVPNDDVSVRPGRGNLDEASPLGLLVKVDGSASFIEFTFGTAPAVAATLRLHNSWTNAGAPVNCNVRIRGGVYAFDARLLTHANQPDDAAWTVVVDSFHVVNEPASYTFDITDSYNDHGGETVTFSLRSVSGSGDGPIFDDREGTGGNVQGPDGLAVNASGAVGGWLPGAADIGETLALEVEAANAYGSDREAWSVRVVEAPPNPLVGGGWVAHYYKPSGPVVTFPDFDGLPPAAAAIVATIDVPATEGQFIAHGLDFVDDFAVRYEGRIALPAGITVFHVTSEGGARLFANGELVLESPGGFAETSGSATLAAGEHCLVVAPPTTEAPRQRGDTSIPAGRRSATCASKPPVASWCRSRERKWRHFSRAFAPGAT